MDSKTNQKGWMAVVVWVALLGATAYTSNATVNVFNAIIQTLFQTLVNGIGDLFTNYGVLFATLLSIGLVFLLLSAWLGLVTYTFEIGGFIFGKEEDEEEEDSDIFSLPGQIARYLGFSWGLFYILFLMLPMVM
ncbi:MAG: hypothetical protein JW757_07855 [Anaerolineales bacterium]|nr:hypothetical protein [Anaerolineales bacterium]